MDQPTTGGRWVRDPESGALSKVEETSEPLAPAPEAGSETEPKAPKANTAKRGRE